MRRQRSRVMAGMTTVLLGGLLWSQTAAIAYAATSKARASSSAAADSEGSQATDRKLAALEEQLEQVLANQQTILQKFDAVMEEMRIIKVRVSLLGS